MRYIGLDVHKTNTTACVLSAGGKVVRTFEVRSNASGLQALHDYMRKTDYVVMMESSTYSYVAYRFFSDRGVETHVVHARSLRTITDSDKKTDRKDAEAIARYLRLWKKGDLDLSISFIPDREQAELKDLCRYREEISRKLGDDVRRIRAHMRRNCQELPPEFENLATKKAREMIIRSWPHDYTLVDRVHEYSRMLEHSKQIAREVESRGRDDGNIELLAQIPGVGMQTAVQIMSMIVDINRFPDAERLCAYFGLVPRVRDTGGKEIHGRMTKAGDSMMRSVMERVTLSHINHCDSTVTQYYRRKEKEMGRKKALVTASRKMLVVIHSVLKGQRPFTA